jgi:hypothetical protein
MLFYADIRIQHEKTNRKLCNMKKKSQYLRILGGLHSRVPNFGFLQLSPAVSGLSQQNYACGVSRSKLTKPSRNALHIQTSKDCFLAVFLLDFVVQ